MSRETTQKTSDDVLRVSIEPAEGSRVTFITPNWGDRRTWFYKSIKRTGLVLTSGGPNCYTVSTDGSPVCVIDNYHGLYSDEDFLTTADGDIPRAKLYDMGLLKTEEDPHTGIGDYWFDYHHGVAHLNFIPSGQITMDLWEAGPSEYIIKPDPGKKLKIVFVEAQFSVNLQINDSVFFQPRGLADVFAPQLVPNPLPSGTLINLGNPKVYKTMQDYINEANGMKGLIPVLSSGMSWRDLQESVITYPWDYQAVTELDSSSGLEISIKLEHDVPFSGYATATLYGLSYDM